MVSTITRQTGTVARVINDHLNDWTDWAGADINVDVAYQFVGDPMFYYEEYEQRYWSYRGQAAMCVFDDTIVRVRLGDGSPSDRTIYRQIITDPEDPAEWESWTQLYTGDHFAMAIEAAEDGSSYSVYSAKVDGIYVDNVLELAVTNVVRIKPTAFANGRLYFQTVEQDTDGDRVLKWWFTYIFAGTPGIYEDCANYRWYRHDMVCMEIDLEDGGKDLYRFRSMAHEAASRNKLASETLTVDVSYEPTFFHSDGNQWNDVRYIKGPSEQAGFKVISNLYLTGLSSARWPEAGLDVGPSGAYFLFYNERHFDENGNVLSNLKNPLFWQRSVGYPFYLSAPQPVGFSIWGFAGAVQWRDYIWVAGNGRILRRPQMEDSIDLSDYILDGNYEIPRSNQKSTGTLVSANPGNVIGAQLGLDDSSEAGYTERRIELAIGQKGAHDADYTWKVDDSWWISRLRKVRGDDGRQQLMISLGNFWHRMENPFRETITLPGRFEWNDWQPDAPNQPFNYSNAFDEFVSYSPAGADEAYLPHLRTLVSDNPAVPAGMETITLFAGWRGENGYARMLCWEDGGFVFRYQDADNFFFVHATSDGTLALKRYLDGDVATLASTSMDATTPFWLTIDFRWKRIRIDVNFDDIVLTHTLTDPATLTGFVGITSPEVSNFEVSDFNTRLSTKELLRILLAYVDEHEVELEIDEETASAAQLDLIYGPQSDLDTPEKAFRQVLEASNLQIVWLED